MAKKILIVPFLFVSITTFSQIAKDIMIGVGTDLMKTDNDNIAGKAQIGVEGNYFLTRNFTATGGIEIWTADEVSFVTGIRWFPVEEAFIRFRGLIGENDLSLGGGWMKPLDANWKFEAIGDFYFKGEFSIRAGFVYLIRRNY
jgi:hypothetical protein